MGQKLTQPVLCTFLRVHTSRFGIRKLTSHRNLGEASSPQPPTRTSVCSLLLYTDAELRGFVQWETLIADHALWTGGRGRATCPARALGKWESQEESQQPQCTRREALGSFLYLPTVWVRGPVFDVQPYQGLAVKPGQMTASPVLSFVICKSELDKPVEEYSMYS